MGEKNSSGRWKRIGWLFGAVVAVGVAIVLGVGGWPSGSLFDGVNKPCSCSQGERKSSGVVEGCCCNYETVDHLNEEVLHPALQELVKTSFFRHFKVKLWCNCPFWPDDGMCALEDCSVCDCPEKEFPESFRKPNHKGWVEVDNPWTNDDETDNGAYFLPHFSQSSEMTYVNLQLNPERYTGYTGPSARRIWVAVYTENCPKYPSEEFCQEKKILYKLISGLHSSISVHIAVDYLLDKATNLWGQNMTLMYDRVLKHPDRISNLYFTFLFVLRAVTKAADYFEQAEYGTGNPAEDLKTQSLIRQLMFSSELRAACPIPFDEAKLWKGHSGPELKLEVQKQFRNIRFLFPTRGVDYQLFLLSPTATSFLHHHLQLIGLIYAVLNLFSLCNITLHCSALMDCVGCEKCRLWGKLQVLGLGTALKILFSVDGPGQTLQLQRNEVIALMNLLNRLSESVKTVHEMGPSTESIMGGQHQTQNRQVCRLHKMLGGSRGS
uniref:Endoplasmic reticulum oxidoreductin 1 n=1 Tax=Kalanchoe fedtschenkoi TaxID=63787 RepID=A0A7N0RE63_KALFE